MKRLLVDGVFFQLANSGIARVWRTILPLLAQRGDLEILLLDRGNAPAIDGVECLPFPGYTFSNSAADSALIQRICDHRGIDVFASTYYTSPLATPSVLIVHDMIPELFDFDLAQRGWMDKETAIGFALRYLCVSHTTRRDLLAFYPEIAPDHAVVAHCGVDPEVFFERPPAEVEDLRRRHGLDRPYFLFVGSRVQHTGYKNSRLFFDALETVATPDFDVLCVGGEPEIDPGMLRRLPSGMRCLRVELSDAELAAAYGGARALVYPSLYEGFGLPVIEAMASGCPVITTRHGSLAEAAGDAAQVLSGFSATEMRDAIDALRDDGLRSELRARGFEHARRFRWNDMADRLAELLQQATAAHARGACDAFFAEWRRLRLVQARVDLS